MIRTLPRDSALSQALTAIYEAKHAVLITQDERVVPATTDQFISVVLGGPGPAEAHSVLVTQEGFEEIQRLIRREYTHYCHVVGNGHYSLEEFCDKHLARVLHGERQLIKALVTLKKHEVAADNIFEKMLEFNPQDVVQ